MTKAEDISAISKNPEMFSSEKDGVFLREGMPMPLDVLNQVILGMDPPRHTKYRGIVQKAFTPRIVALQEEQIRGRDRQADRRGLRAGRVRPGRARCRSSCRCR